MDFVIMVDNAFYCKRTYTPEAFEDQAARLLSDGHYALDRWGDAMAYKTGTPNNNTMFAFLKNIVMFFVAFDGQLRQGEYNVYKKWCKKCGYIPSSGNELSAYSDRYSVSEYVKNVDILARLREEIDSTHYQNMVYGLIMLAVYCENVFTEEAYNVLKRFFRPGFDNCPSYRELVSQIYY